MNSPVTLLIRDQPRLGINTDTYTTFKLHRIDLVEIDQTTLCDRIPILERKYKILSILVESKENEPHQVELARDVQRVFLRLLRKGRPHPMYCCVDACMDSFSLYSNKSVNNLIGLWEAQSFDNEDILKPGDWIVLLGMKENDKPNVHFAVYLTHGIYLSLFGSTGSIIASTLQEMKKGFSTPHAAKLTLQDESSQSLGTLRVKDLK